MCRGWERSAAFDLFQSMTRIPATSARGVETRHRRDRRIGTRNLTMMVGAAFTVLSGCTATGGSTLRIPELYVMASTANDARVETRVSVDGRLWATAAGLANANGTPASTLQNTPPGIGAIGTGYVIAWFDPGRRPLGGGLARMRWSSTARPAARPVR
jgi:hypothetical protein